MEDLATTANPFDHAPGVPDETLALSVSVPVPQVPKQLKCDLCSYVCAKPSRFAEHTRSHTGERPFQCSFEGCSFSTAHKNSWRKHIASHVNGRCHACEMPGCSYRTSYKNSLARHREKSHAVEEPDKILCSWAGCSFAGVSLKAHYRTHTNEMKYFCTQCSYASKEKDGLSTHIGDSHAVSAKPFRCEFVGCDFASKWKNTLKKHARRHTGEKPFKCDWPECAFAAARKDYVDQHHSSHTGKRPFSCTQPGCSFRAVDKARLAKHERVHANNRPFHCEWPDCLYAAVRKDYVTNHLRTHTRDRSAAGGPERKQKDTLVMPPAALSSAPHVGLPVVVVAMPPADEAPGLADLSRPPAPEELRPLAGPDADGTGDSTLPQPFNASPWLLTSAEPEEEDTASGFLVFPPDGED